MRKRLLALEIQDSRVVSFSDYYEEKMDQRRVMNWSPSVQLVDSDTELPVPLRGERPQGSETDVVKPFWRRTLEENTLVPSFANGYEVGYIGPKIADIAFYPINVARPSAGEYVAFGDAKGAGWTGTSKREKGQVMMYGHRILDAQPQRSHVYGFITNNSRVVLIRTARSNEAPFAIIWGISPVLTFEYGMKVFFHLLQHDHGYVNPPSVMGHPVEIRQPLRPGGTCRAFGAVYRNADVVVKLYVDSDRAQGDASKVTRANIAVQGSAVDDPKADIPRVEGVEGCWLLLSPLGTRFTSSSFKLQHLKKLLRTLEIVHKANIIHRDVRFANIFSLPDNRVLLNDWGASTVGGSVQLVEGCPPPFCHPELVDVAEAVPVPKHDLYSLVVSTAHLLLPGMVDSVSKKILATAFAAVERVDYDGVWQGLQHTVFGSDMDGKAGVP